MTLLRDSSPGRLCLQASDSHETRCLACEILLIDVDATVNEVLEQGLQMGTLITRQDMQYIVTGVVLAKR